MRRMFRGRIVNIRHRFRRIVATLSAPSAQQISVPSIPSAESWGAPSVVLILKPTGIASAEAFGTAKIRLAITPAGIASSEAWGTPRIVERVALGGIASAEAWGSPSIRLRIAIGGIPSTEAWGTPSLRLIVRPTGIASAEAWGTPIVTGPISVPGIPSAEAWGAPTVVDLTPQPPAPEPQGGGGVVIVGRRRPYITPPRQPLVLPHRLYARAGAETGGTVRAASIRRTAATCTGALALTAHARGIHRSGATADATGLLRALPSTARFHIGIVGTAQPRPVASLRAYHEAASIVVARAEDIDGDDSLMGEDLLALIG